ncbi:hypothetical protein [Haladaptatus salinisoli]|uniref:hypothetical protein n=1 Tax=Haladaptatus salinisoli TaxID=2884876 RepID=UPI001D0B71BF|nr:hypothetical protein [Haladaptatus salinisoli]
MGSDDRRGGRRAGVLVRWLGAAVSAQFGEIGIVLFVPFYVVSLVAGAYFVVCGLGKLVEDVVRREITHRS